jgi:ABC-2 type transport system permease protein
VTLRPYDAAFVSGVRRALGQPGELSVRVLFYVFILIVFAALWGSATGARGGEIAGYDYAALMWYVVGAEAAVVAINPRLIETIGTSIGDGTIATEMLRPASVVGFRMAAELGEAFVRLVSAVVVGAAFAAFVVGAPRDVGSAVLAAPAALLAVMCSLAAQHTFAAAAFWLDDAKSSWFLYQKLIFLLGGMLLPLELLPSWLEQAARSLPFWAMAYVPARLLSGHAEPVLLLVQAAWLLALTAAATYAFRVGERRLQVVGG